MLALVTWVTLSAAAGSVKLAAIGFTSAGITVEQQQFYSEHFALRLSQRPGIRVVSQKDTAALLGVERQRQLLGCAESNCMAELAGALGVDGIVTGQVARIGSVYQLDVKVLSGSGAAPLAVASRRVSDEEHLLDEMDEMADEIAAHLVQPPRAEARRWPAWLLVGAGGAAVVVGGIFLGKMATDWNTLTGSGAAQVSNEMALAARNDGRVSTPLGYALASIGLAAILTGVVWLFVGSGP
jgi:hypothetical protein